MKKNIVLICIVLSIFSCESGKLANLGSTISQRRLLEDFDRFYDIILISHPKPFTSLEELEEIKNIQREKVKRMSKLEFYKILSPIISKVNCGHTFLHAGYGMDSEAIGNGNFLPIQVKVIDRKIFLIKDFSQNDIDPGSEIISINSIKSDKIIDKLFSSISSDGDIETSKVDMLNRGLRFNFYYYLLIESSSTYNIEYVSHNDSYLNETIVKSTDWDGVLSNYNETPYKYIYKDHISYEINDNYALLTIPHFNYYSESKFADFSKEIDQFFIKLKELKIDDLLVDLRGNGGGDPFAGNLLLTYILEEPFQYFADNTAFYDNLVQDSEINKNSFRGRIYTLIDGGCFSTTGHVLSLIKDQNRGVIIGQESGGGYMCSDYSKEVTLNNSGLKFNVAKQIFATSVVGQELGRGIIPDVQIDYTIDDYISEKDLEMEYATRFIKEN